MQTLSVALGVPTPTANSSQLVRAESITSTLVVTPLHLQGALQQVQQTSPTVSSPISWHSIPERKPPSVALGALPSTRLEDPLGLERMGFSHP